MFPSFLFFLTFFRGIYLEFFRVFSSSRWFCDALLENFFRSCRGFCGTSCMGDGLLGNLIVV